MDAEPEDAGEVTGEGVYKEGERVTLVVGSEEGYEFRKWVEDGQTVSEDEQYEFELEEDRQLTAVFEIKEYEVKVEPNDERMGLVSGGGHYEHGQNVLVTAEPYESYLFKCWVKDGEVLKDAGQKYEFAVEQDTNLVAVYYVDPKELVLTDDLTGLLLPIRETGNLGFICEKGETVVQPHEILDAAFWLSTRGLESVEVDSKNPLVLGLSVHEGGDLTVVFNQHGKMVAQIPTLGRLYNDYGIVSYEDGHYGFVDHEGNRILDFKYDDVTILHRNHPRFLELSRGGQKGVFDSKQRENILDVAFDEIEEFGWLEHGRFKGEKQGDTYLFDLQGKMVAEIDFDEIQRPSDGLVAVRDDEDWGFIDMDGDVVIEPQFEKVDRYSEGFSSVKHGGKWGVLDKEGSWFLEPEFEEVIGSEQGFCSVKYEEKWGVIDTDGDWFVEPQFDEIGRHLGVDLTRFVHEDTIGFFDEEGDVVVQGSYDRLNKLSDAFIFEQNDRWGVLSGEGEVVEHAVFEEICWGAFEMSQIYPGVDCNALRVKTAEGWGLYAVENKNYIIPPGRYDDAHYLIGGRVRVKSDETFGFMNEWGEEVIETRYDQATHFINGVAAVQDDGYLHFIDKNGANVVEPVEFDGDEGISLHYFEGSGLYKTVGFGYFCTDRGWIRKPR